MFSLGADDGTRWIALPHGVRVQVRPIDATVHGAALAAVRRQTQAILQERKERVETSAPADDLPDLDDPDYRTGWSGVQFSAALARYAILDWEGVAEPPTAANAARMMLRHHDMSEAFLNAMLAPLDAQVAEGNGSAPAPPGSSAAGAPIASDARPAAPPAPGT